MAGGHRSFRASKVSIEQPPRYRKRDLRSRACVESTDPGSRVMLADNSPAAVRRLLRILAACAALAVPLNAPASAETAFSQLTEQEREELGNEIRRYILDNPEVIVEALIRMQERERLAEAERGRARVGLFSDELFADRDSWAGGNLDGDITVVEFIDYRCGFCRRSQGIVEELINSDGNIRLVLKEFPILGEDSEFAARIAVAVLQLAGAPSYKAVHDRLMTHRGAFDDTLVAEMAKVAGIGPKELSVRMFEDTVVNVIAKNHLLAREMGIEGTPAFVIGGQLVGGFNELDQLRDYVAQERTRLQ